MLSAAMRVGVADRALEVARPDAPERAPLGVPIGSLPAVERMLADMDVRTGMARSATDATDATDATEGIAVEASADGVLRIELRRPDRRNALGAAAVRHIIRTLEAASTDDALRAVVITGAGRDFCAGADWVATNTGSGEATGGAGPAPHGAADRHGADRDAVVDGGPQPQPQARPRPRPGGVQRRMALEAHRLVAVLTDIHLPVVCQVQGWAAGLGCQIALAADFTVAAETGRFWLPFTKRGFSADSGATWLVPRLIGVARAKEMLLLGRAVTGAEAAAWGMIHRAVPEPDLGATTQGLVAELAASATVAVGLTKHGIHRSLETGLVEAMDAEAAALEVSSRTADFKEGLRAFQERRDPRFEGR